jgi:hypothetical protein
MSNLERRIERLEQESGTGEPVELCIHTGVPRYEGDSCIRRLLFPDGMGTSAKVIISGVEHEP